MKVMKVNENGKEIIMRVKLHTAETHSRIGHFENELQFHK